MAYDRGGFARILRYGDPLPATLSITSAKREWVEGQFYDR
jgi:hypothetical protein